MKKIKDRLIDLSKSLVTLSKEVENIQKQIDKLEKTKTVRVTKKVKSKKATPVKESIMLDTVFDIIKRTKKGITVAQLKEKSYLDSRKLSNALYKLTKK